MKHLTLRDKISNIVSTDQEVDKIMDYIFWEVSKLQSKNPMASHNKVVKFLKNIKK